MLGCLNAFLQNLMNIILVDIGGWISIRFIFTSDTTCPRRHLSRESRFFFEFLFFYFFQVPILVWLRGGRQLIQRILQFNPDPSRQSESHCHWENERRRTETRNIRSIDVTSNLIRIHFYLQITIHRRNNIRWSDRSNKLF